MRRKKNRINLIRKNRIPLGRIAGYGSMGMLTLLFVIMLLPITSDSSFATCTPDSSAEECLAMPLSTELGVTTKTVISLALDNQIQMEVVPRSNGATSYASTRLAVSTNSNDGYAIYLQAGSETGNLTGVTTNLSGEISNTAKDKVTLDNLENNAYGYALSKTTINDSTTYSHVPTSSTVIESTTSSAQAGGDYAYGDTYYLAFGTKIGTNLPAGQYAGTVTVSAVANPTTLRSMYDLTYMQDMTSDICANTREHYTKQLIDTRDGKSYWVAKLKDGNCWMTQNLALDLSTEKTLTPSDSDILADWKPDNNTETEIPEKTDADYTSTRSWNLGNIILTNPTGSELCPKQNNDIWNSALTGQKITETCPNYYKDVTEWMPNYKATETSSIDTSGKYYDAHYLLGNYYQYNTLTAGTSEAATAQNTVAASSICPKGWMLPASDKNDANQPIVNPNQTKASFHQLLLAYGYPETNEYTTSGSDAFVTIHNKDTYAEDNLTVGPMYFVRGGGVYPDLGTMRGAGDRGYYWSSATVPNSSTLAYNLWFNTKNIYPSDSRGRITGYPARCVAR